MSNLLWLLPSIREGSRAFRSDTYGLFPELRDIERLTSYSATSLGTLLRRQQRACNSAARHSSAGSFRTGVRAALASGVEHLAETTSAIAVREPRSEQLD